VVTSEADIPLEKPESIEIYISEPGTCVQRNYGVEKVAPGTDYIAFFDDDFEMREDYLQKAVEFFDEVPAVAGFSGMVIRDGGVTREEAKQIIASYQPKEDYRGIFIRGVKYAILYGCCMMIRSHLLAYEKFDENLPLYGFGEDYDFSMRIKRYGFIGRYNNCLGVHLKSPGGRVNEVQRGYAIVANNWYFLRKGVSHLPPVLAIFRFWFVVVLKLLIDALWRALKGDKTLDWAGRARGFCFAVGDIVLGRSSPRRIMDFSKS
jgi:GT2 family glycosyltransferase